MAHPRSGAYSPPVRLFADLGAAPARGVASESEMRTSALSLRWITATDESMPTQAPSIAPRPGPDPDQPKRWSVDFVHETLAASRPLSHSQRRGSVESSSPVIEAGFLISRRGEIMSQILDRVLGEG